MYSQKVEEMSQRQIQGLQEVIAGGSALSEAYETPQKPEVVADPRSIDKIRQIVQDIDRSENELLLLQQKEFQEAIDLLNSQKQKEADQQISKNQEIQKQFEQQQQKLSFLKQETDKKPALLSSPRPHDFDQSSIEHRSEVVQTLDSPMAQIGNILANKNFSTTSSQVGVSSLFNDPLTKNFSISIRNCSAGRQRECSDEAAL